MVEKIYSVAKNGLLDIHEEKVVKETPKTYVLDRICDKVVRKSEMQNRWELFFTDITKALKVHKQLAEGKNYEKK